MNYSGKVLSYDEEGFLLFSVPSDLKEECEDLESVKEACVLADVNGHVNQINNYGMVTNQDTIGFFLQNSDSSLAILLGNEFSPYIFRGENKDFPDFKPSLKRLEDFSKEKRDNLSTSLSYHEALIKKQVFIDFFKSTPYVNRCSKINVFGHNYHFDYEACAQHYGFKSNYLDVTKDLLVALFFAYTYYDEGGYHPIVDFESYSPSLYISTTQKLYTNLSDKFKFISFQSLLRPYCQKAFAIDSTCEILSKDQFDKISLPRSPAIASEIFNKCKGGKTLFPENDLISPYADAINNLKSFPLKTIDEYCNQNSIQDSLRDNLKNEYGDNNMRDNQILLSGGEYCQMNNEVDCIMKFLSDLNRFSFRLTCPSRNDPFFLVNMLICCVIIDKR